MLNKKIQCFGSQNMVFWVCHYWMSFLPVIITIHDVINRLWVSSTFLDTRMVMKSANYWLIIDLYEKILHFYSKGYSITLPGIAFLIDLFQSRLVRWINLPLFQSVCIDLCKQNANNVNSRGAERQTCRCDWYTCFPLAIWLLLHCNWKRSHLHKHILIKQS